MKKMFLMASVAALAFGITSESWADCPVSDQTCGTNCCWELNNGKLTVSAKDGATDVFMDGYYFSPAPWDKSSITSVEIGDGIKEIGTNAFYGATNLASVTISDSVAYIGMQTFANTPNLTSITLPNSINSFGDNAFSSSGLTSFTFPDSIEYMGRLPFQNNSSLTTIIIPDSWGDKWGDATEFYEGGPASDLFEGSCFASSGRPSGCPDDMSQVKIACQGDTNKCEAALGMFKPGGMACDNDYNYNHYCLNSSVQVVSANEAQCNTSANYYYATEGCQKLPNTQESCENANLYWANNKCTKPASVIEENHVSENTTCPDGYEFKQGEGCVDKYPYSKKHWTPAEANKWLYDDNNTITITFKHK